MGRVLFDHMRQLGTLPLDHLRGLSGAGSQSLELFDLEQQHGLWPSDHLCGVIFADGGFVLSKRLGFNLAALCGHAMLSLRSLLSCVRTSVHAVAAGRRVCPAALCAIGSEDSSRYHHWHCTTRYLGMRKLGMPHWGRLSSMGCNSLDSSPL